MLKKKKSEEKREREWKGRTGKKWERKKEGVSRHSEHDVIQS